MAMKIRLAQFLGKLRSLTSPKPPQQVVPPIIPTVAPQQRTAESFLDDIYQGRLDLSPAIINIFKDIRVAAQIEAAQLSAKWIAENADKDDTYATRHEMLVRICELPVPDGDLAEFGVYTGAVTRFLRPRFADRAYHAFDSFEGVPESMSLAIRAGDFSLGGKIPDLPEGVTVHPGWFDSSLPKFRAGYEGRLAFVYVDCDLYSSAKTVLDNIYDRLAPGAIVAFDDWYNFPNWQAHSYRALTELSERTGLCFEPISVTVRQHAAAFRLKI